MSRRAFTIQKRNKRTFLYNKRIIILKGTFYTTDPRILNVSVDGTLGEWDGVYFFSGHTDAYTAICGDQPFTNSRTCIAPINGGIPCKELIDNNMPTRSYNGPPYRCNCELISIVQCIDSSKLPIWLILSQFLIS